MKKIVLPALLVLAFCAAGISGKILFDRCGELREKQARQEAILLKQSEILAVNTAMLQVVAASLPLKNNHAPTGKAGLKMEAMP